MDLALPDQRWDNEAARRHARAWALLVVAIAVHVVDEALTGFLDFYNPFVFSIRERYRWLPFPTFTFPMWIGGLAVLVLILGSLTSDVHNGTIGTRAASWVLSLIMFMNGAGHLVGSVYFKSWLPGATSAPLLIIASGLLAVATWQRQPIRRTRIRQRNG